MTADLLQLSLPLAVNAFVAVTDNEWFRYLSSLPGVDEVNFWQPSGGRGFRVLQPGEPLLFKLHAPENFIAGGGFFVKWSSLPFSLAWEAFGPKNGAPSLEVMRARIEHYRRVPASPIDYEIGCIVLAQPFFSRATSGSRHRRTSTPTSLWGRPTT